MAGVSEFALLDLLPEGIAYARVLDREGVADDLLFLYANPACGEQTGLDLFPGARLSDLVPVLQETGWDALAACGRVASSGGMETGDVFVPSRRCSLEFQVRSPRPGHVLIHLSPLDPERQAVRLRALLAALPDLLFETDREGVVHDYHSRSDRLLVVPPETFLGRNVAEFLPPEAVRQIREALEEAAARGVSRGRTYSLDIPAGRRWFELSAAPMPAPEAGTEHFVVLARDITDRQEVEDRLRVSEQRHRLLAENARDVIWTMAPDGRITYVSPAVEAVRGLTPAEAMAQPLDQIHPPESRARSAAYFQKLVSDLQAGRPPEGFRGELEYYHKDGSTFWTEVLTYPVLAPDGTFVELVGVTRDLSERKRLELELREARDAAEAASAAKSEFLAHMSHELRTPLNAILGLSHATLTSPLSPGQRDHLEKIQASARTLLELIGDILDLSKTEAGRLDLEDVPFRLDELLRSSLDVVSLQARARNLELGSHLEPDVPRGVRGDPLRLRQVLLNLLSNAVKFTDHGRVELGARVIAVEATRVRVRFQVRDTGPGIPEEEQARLFEPFTQLDGSVTREHGGTGLGLSIALRLVRLMGGELLVESAPGSGSTFHFEIPLVLAPEAEETPAEAPVEAPSLEGGRVLVVEDNPLNQYVARELLRLLGVEAEVASGGEEALLRLERPPGFDAVLLDIQMADLDGLEVARWVRAREDLGTLPLIALTAQAHPRDRQLCLDAGMDDYLPKPIDPDALRAALARWITPRPGPGSPPPPARSPAPASLPGVDMEAALKRCRGNREWVLGLLEEFEATVDDRRRLLRCAVEEGDARRAARAAHSLRGVALTLCMPHLAAAAERLERAFGNGTTREWTEALQAVERALALFQAGWAESGPGRRPQTMGPPLGA